ncbi:MAG: 2-C-methyl-D-erythritol 4-phosphate cytidylyltransferase [Phycisphaerae bacterium]
MAKFSVIVAAAGKGERFGGREKKTFAKLDGRPMFIQTLQRFVKRDDLSETILAVAPEDFDMVKTKFGPNIAFMGVKLVKGGARRYDTVAAALDAVSEDADYVAIHDAARPCVTDEWIDAVFAEAVKSGAAILATPVAGTLKRVSSQNVIEGTVSREGLFEAQTPQVFRKDLIVDGLAQLADDAEEITDDSQLVERLNHPVSIVLCDATNLKVTTKGDLKLAAAILKSRPVKAAKPFGAFEEAQW